MPWLVGGVVDLLFGGWLIGRLIRNGWPADLIRRAVLAGGTVMGLGIFGAARAQSPAEAIFWISISLAGISAAAPVIWTLPSLIAPDGSDGKVGAAMNFWGQVSGIVAPIATGYLIKEGTSFFWAFGVA